MQPKILLVNPPIYDFSAYDFWLKPYKALARCQVSAWPGTVVPVRLSRPLSPSSAVSPSTASRDVGAGAILCRKRAEARAVHCHSTYVPALWAAPITLSNHVGRGRSLRCSLDPDGHDLLVSWRPGRSSRTFAPYSPQTTIVLGGVYATLCPQHARRLGPDLVIDRAHLEPLWSCCVSPLSCRGFLSGRPMRTCV